MTTKKTPLKIAIAQLERCLHQLATSPHEDDWRVANETRAALATIRSAPVETLADDADAVLFVTEYIEAITRGSSSGMTKMYLSAIDAYRKQRSGTPTTIGSQK
jgi:hypothetical protein